MAGGHEASNVGSLEEEALKRKERLKAMKRGEIKSLHGDGDVDADQAKSDELMFPKPIFRNYTPKDEALKPGVLPKPKLIEIENEIQDRLASGKPQPLIEKEIDLATLAPQKIDWDLKRDAEKKLRLLEKRTQRAIVELIRERLQQQKNADLAELVSVASRTDATKSGQNDDDDDDDEDNEQQTGDANQSQSATEDDDPPSPMFVNDKREISDDDDY